MASLGSLVIELAANTARLQSDMGKAVGIVESGARKMKSVFAAFGVVGGGGFLAAVIGNTAKEAIKLGDDIQKASVKAGIGGRAMSELAHAAKMADVDLASLSTALKKMQVNLSEAGTGAKQPIEALKALGLSITDLQKRKPEAQFELLADRISQLKDPADRARAATELFGKAGADLLPLFEQGAAGIAKARQEAERMGIALGDEQLKALADADDSIKRLSASWEGFAATLTAKVAPALSSVLDILSGASASTSGKVAELEGQVQRLEARGRGNPDVQQRISALRQQLEDARIHAGFERLPAGAGGRGRTFGQAIGFKPDTTEADKAFDKFSKSFNNTTDDLMDEFNKMLADQRHESQDAWSETLVNWQEFEDDRLEAEEETNKSISKMREEQASQLSATAQLWKSTFLNAFDDMVNTGKIKWKELLKYMAAEIGRNAISNAFDSFFGGGKNGGGSSLGGILKGLFGGFSRGSTDSTASWIADFAGTRANGGPVQAGKLYRVNERGMEWFKPSVSGNILPVGSGGGRMVTIAPVYNISNPDNTAALPRILRENNRQLVNQLQREGLLGAA